MAEFVKRVESDMNRFGERAKEAELNHGLDYKALSHALRALLQMEELLLTGRIVFPLKGRAELIALKEGKLDWRDIENRILSMLDRVGSLQKNAPYVGKPEEEFANACIFNCYGLKTRIATAIVLSDRNNARFESGFEVPDDTLKLIHSKLREAERTKNVKILYCCESGSRGWNFASANSDYDVRFIYIHDMDWYLGVSPEDKSDTIDLGIEKSVCGELDINGWELRKTLKLLRKSNGPLLEKLSSPIVYEEIYSFSKNLRDLAKQLFNPLAAWHHYRGLIERSAERLLTEKPSIKTWFYVLRPLLYMKWIENGHGIPPMRFDNVMNAVVDNEEIKEEIFRLVELKKSWGEYDEFHPSRVICEYIEQLRPQMNPPNPPMAKKVIPDLDGFFRRILELCSPSEKNA
ncbi:hypothetical protein FACS1894187_25030 [Synergistales bacterium]|nr:hypothetical protein FACS1894187_25030 [Synergistales bacterium]